MKDKLQTKSEEKAVVVCETQRSSPDPAENVETTVEADAASTSPCSGKDELIVYDSPAEDGLQLLDLPEHVLILVFIHLSNVDLCSLALTCRVLARVSSDNVLWFRIFKKTHGEFAKVKKRRDITRSCAIKRLYANYCRFKATPTADVSSIIQDSLLRFPNRCTFVVTGTQMETQFFYYCKTCAILSAKNNSSSYMLSESNGCCEACARICHKGHAILKLSHNPCLSYCDCGEGKLAAYLPSGNCLCILNPDINAHQPQQQHQPPATSSSQQEQN